MSLDRFPVGLEMDVSYPGCALRLRLLSTTRLAFEARDGASARDEVVAIETVPLGHGLFAVSWQEQDGTTVAQVQDFTRLRVLSCATRPDGRLLRRTGTMAITRAPVATRDHRPQTQQDADAAGNGQPARGLSRMDDGKDATWSS